MVTDTPWNTNNMSLLVKIHTNFLSLPIKKYVCLKTYTHLAATFKELANSFYHPDTALVSILDNLSCDCYTLGPWSIIFMFVLPIDNDLRD